MLYPRAKWDYTINRENDSLIPSYKNTYVYILLVPNQKNKAQAASITRLKVINFGHIWWSLGTFHIAFQFCAYKVCSAELHRSCT